MQAAGFVLVGGRSSRMGRDKALLRWESHSLLEDVAARVRDAAGNVALLGPPERYEMFTLECLPDLHPNFGPLAGIETALASARGELNLIVACDMPGVEPHWLQMLLESAERNGALCTVLRDPSGTTHPLCAVYRSACLPVIQRRLNAAQLRVQDAVCELRAAIVDAAAELANLNTQDDWHAWRTAQTPRVSHAD